MAPRATTSGTADAIAPSRRRFSWVLLAIGATTWVSWLAWRLTVLGPHPVEVAVLVLELVGFVASVLVTIGLVRATAHRRMFDDDPRDSHRYAHAVADQVGRTRAADLRHDLRSLVDRITDRTIRTRADRAMMGVLIDGPRRIALVVVVGLALLLGVAPLPMPPAWALVAVAVSALARSLSHVVATNGRIRLGDRTRWSFAAMGEVLSAADREDLAPRRWVGVMGTVVIMNIAIALRGMSDRWTHGLPPMSSDDRIVAMAIALMTVVGALYTLGTTPQPDLPNAHLVSRRLEERTARQSTLGAAVCVGVIGLLAGILPGAVDAADPQPAPARAPVELERIVGDG